MKISHEQFSKPSYLPADSAEQAMSSPGKLIEIWNDVFRVANLAPEVCQRLDQLDDLVFAAIEGDADALEDALANWESIRSELGDDVLEESLAQYQRRAKSVWDELHRQPHLTPHKSFAALEILGLLEGKRDSPNA